MSKFRSDFSNVTEVELVYKNPVNPVDRVHVKSSRDAYDVLFNTWDDGKLELQEQFRVLLLDRKNAVLGISTVAMGGISECMVDLKIVFALALKARASSIILSHNHPSGNTAFSDADIKLTKKFMEVAHVHDMTIHDHIVVTRDAYSSMADYGQMPQLGSSYRPNGN